MGQCSSLFPLTLVQPAKIKWGVGLCKTLNASWGLDSVGYYPKNHDRNSITSFCPMKFHSSPKDPSVSASFFHSSSSLCIPLLLWGEWVKSIILGVLECWGFLLNAKQSYHIAHCSTGSKGTDGQWGAEQTFDKPANITSCMFHLNTTYRKQAYNYGCRTLKTYCIH